MWPRNSWKQLICLHCICFVYYKLYISNISIFSDVFINISSFLSLSSLTLTKPLGASVSIKTWLQESSDIKSEMNLTGVAFTSCRLTHSRTDGEQNNDNDIFDSAAWSFFCVVAKILVLFISDIVIKVSNLSFFFSPNHIEVCRGLGI